MRRVVVTGMGAITPMGLNVKEYFDKISQMKPPFLAEKWKFFH